MVLVFQGYHDFLSLWRAETDFKNHKKVVLKSPQVENSLYRCLSESQRRTALPPHQESGELSVEAEGHEK